MAVLEGVAGRWEGVGSWLDVPEVMMNIIDSDYVSDEEKLRACVFYWVHHDPYASWRKLVWRLDNSGSPDLKEVADEMGGLKEGLTGQCLFCQWSGYWSHHSLVCR
jgi:hypothetical protein